MAKEGDVRGRGLEATTGELASGPSRYLRPSAVLIRGFQSLSWIQRAEGPPGRAEGAPGAGIGRGPCAHTHSKDHAANECP